MILQTAGDEPGRPRRDTEEWAAQAQMERTAHALTVVLRRLGRAERETFQQSFHRVCCLNSQDGRDLAVMNRVVGLLDEEMGKPDYS
ncbi:hypothetical protein ACFV0C_17150 [Streptomyces sp. NPDC059568]|uniref:hypothetical protein n=1 Tax=Streptomyces sp. NPDC059568 TaxID=3346868 RepID=UPI0036C06D40